MRLDFKTQEVKKLEIDCEDGSQLILTLRSIPYTESKKIQNELDTLNLALTGKGKNGAKVKRIEIPEYLESAIILLSDAKAEELRSKGFTVGQLTQILDSLKSLVEQKYRPDIEEKKSPSDLDSTTSEQSEQESQEKN